MYYFLQRQGAKTGVWQSQMSGRRAGFYQRSICEKEPQGGPPF